MRKWLVGLCAMFLASSVYAQTTNIRILGVIVKHQNVTQPYTPTNLSKVIFGSISTPKSIAAFYNEVSYGKLQIVGTVHPRVVTLPWDTDGCSWKPTETAAALKADGIDLTQYDMAAIVSTKAPIVCGGGFAGGMNIPKADGTTYRLRTSVTWSINQQNIAHEIGHLIGWGESITINCVDPANYNKRLPLGGSCRNTIYGNSYDVMGTSAMQTANAANRAALGWTTPLVWTGGTQTYKLGPASAPGALPNALQVKLPAGTATVTKERSIWVEYRRPIGFDERMGRMAPLNTTGAFMLAEGAWSQMVGTTKRSYSCPNRWPCLLDMGTATLGFADAALQVGQSWTDPWTGVRITAVDRTDTELTVKVEGP